MQEAWVPTLILSLAGELFGLVVFSVLAWSWGDVLTPAHLEMTTTGCQNEELECLRRLSPYMGTCDILLSQANGEGSIDNWHFLGQSTELRAFVASLNDYKVPGRKGLCIAFLWLQ